MKGLMTVNQITSFLLYQLQLGEVFYVSFFKSGVFWVSGGLLNPSLYISSVWACWTKLYTIIKFRILALFWHITVTKHLDSSPWNSQIKQSSRDPKISANLTSFQYMKLVFSSLMEGVGASRKIFEYMHRKPEIAYNGAVKKPIEGQVDFVDVTFSYPNRPNRDILKVCFLGSN